MSLNDYLYLNSVRDMEGHSQQVPQQTETLKRLIAPSHIKRIFEIGFNAGHSSDTFLRTRRDVSVVSCDIQANEKCVEVGKKYIDATFPSRHSLLIGDSTKIVPLFTENNPYTKFDMIFIDGGHLYEVAMADMLNCQKLAHDQTLVVVDDIVSDLNNDTPLWAIGPTQVWKELVQRNFIQELGHETYALGRGMSWGMYTSTSKI